MLVYSESDVQGASIQSHEESDTECFKVGMLVYSESDVQGASIQSHTECFKVGMLVRV